MRIVFEVVALVLMGCYVPFLFKPTKTRPAYNYQLYVTAPGIADKWHDSNLIGLCSRCGMDDSPIVVPANAAGGDKCKWCAENDNITWHLENKGRFNTKPHSDIVMNLDGPESKSAAQQMREVATRYGTEIKEARGEIEKLQAGNKTLHEALKKTHHERELKRKLEIAKAKGLEVTVVHNGNGEVIDYYTRDSSEPVIDYIFPDPRSQMAVYEENIKYLTLRDE